MSSADRKERYLEVALNLPLSGTFTYRDLPDAEGAPEGRRVEVEFGRRRMSGFVVTSSVEKPDGDYTIKPVLRFIDKTPVFRERELALARWIQRLYFCSLGQALATMIPSGRRPVPPEHTPGADNQEAGLFTLSQAQEKIMEPIRQGIAANTGQRFLIHGITGSGKTEIYRHAARHALERGQAVIILVPEISLTPQTVNRFRAVFKEAVAVLHSRLTASQRFHQWLDILEGKATVIIGARSAVFAPISRDPLIIIDEEHENSYKAGDCPRYHARQVAMHLTRSRGTVILGSATPGFETIFHARSAASANIQYLHLQERISPLPNPSIKIIDMNEESGGAIIALQLVRAVQAAAAAGNQSILFLNRRGFSPSVICRDCDAPLNCPHCSISLTLHQNKGRLVCHYCGYSIPHSGQCPTCSGTRLYISGAGTERAEDFLRQRDPKLRISRIDSDAVANRSSLFEKLEAFRAHETDVLIGTQMVTKGLDFPDVTVVGVLNADSNLTLPDFRAGERSFNQLVQVIGRCGRLHKPGQAYIQTRLPHDTTIQGVVNDSFEQVYEAEMSMRKEAFYPPHARLLRLVVRSPGQARARQRIEELAKNLQAKLPPGADILGPTPCPIERIARNYRFQILLKHRDSAALVRLLHSLGLHEGSHRETYLEIDIDPVSML